MQFSSNQNISNKVSLTEINKLFEDTIKLAQKSHLAHNSKNYDAKENCKFHIEFEKLVNATQNLNNEDKNNFLSNIKNRVDCEIYTNLAETLVNTNLMIRMQDTSKIPLVLEKLLKNPETKAGYGDVLHQLFVAKKNNEITQENADDIISKAVLNEKILKTFNKEECIRLLSFAIERNDITSNNFVQDKFIELYNSNNSQIKNAAIKNILDTDYIDIPAFSSVVNDYFENGMFTSNKEDIEQYANYLYIKSINEKISDATKENIKIFLETYPIDEFDDNISKLIKISEDGKITLDGVMQRYSILKNSNLNNKIVPISELSLNDYCIFKDETNYSFDLNELGNLKDEFVSQAQIATMRYFDYISQKTSTGPSSQKRIIRSIDTLLSLGLNEDDCLKALYKNEKGPRVCFTITDILDSLETLHKQNKLSCESIAKAIDFMLGNRIEIMATLYNKYNLNDEKMSEHPCSSSLQDITNILEFRKKLNLNNYFNLEDKKKTYLKITNSLSSLPSKFFQYDDALSNGNLSKVLLDISQVASHNDTILSKFQNFIKENLKYEKNIPPTSVIGTLKFLGNKKEFQKEILNLEKCNNQEIRQDVFRSLLENRLLELNEDPLSMSKNELFYNSHIIINHIKESKSFNLNDYEILANILTKTELYLKTSQDEILTIFEEHMRKDKIPSFIQNKILNDINSIYE